MTNNTIFPIRLFTYGSKEDRFFFGVLVSNFDESYMELRSHSRKNFEVVPRGNFNTNFDQNFNTNFEVRQNS